MKLHVRPGTRLEGETVVPGDKSVAHRWLILAGTAVGPSRLEGLPLSLDVRSTASCVASLAPKARRGLDVWTHKAPSTLEGGRSTWNANADPEAIPVVEVEGDGRWGLVEPGAPLDCGNSGTSMRLLAGVLAGVPFEAVLAGDESLTNRPMERIAAPLRAMGATVTTTDGHAPVTVRGGALVGIRYPTPVPSAQVKGAVLLAALGADGETVVVEAAPTRDHTERALAALGAPVRANGNAVTVGRFQHEGFSARVPGDPSSAAFLIAAAALTGSSVTIRDVGLNPTRLHFLEVMRRMGVEVTTTVEHEELGEPVGTVTVHPADVIAPVQVGADELPLVIDEVPVLAAVATSAPAESRFLGARELRVKESDRVAALVEGIRSLGGEAADEGDDLVIAGGGLTGGVAASGGDHRMAMAFAVGALAAAGPSRIDGVEAADVSFPGFATTLASLGAFAEVQT